MASLFRRRGTTRGSVEGKPAAGLPHFGGDESDTSVSAPGKTRGSGARSSFRRSAGTTFDERVRSVRSKIREMMAAAGEDSGSGSEIFDGSAEPQEAAPAPIPSSRASSSGSRPPRASAPPAPVELGDLGELGTPGGRGSRSQASAAPARRTLPCPPASAEIQYAEGAGLPPGAKVVGRDVEAHVGDRVRVIDPKIARFVEPTGTITEVRCGGERVRVEHDGPEHALRYYNTGKGGEHQIVLEAPCSAPQPEIAPTARNELTVGGASGSRATLRQDNRQSIAAAPAETPEEPEAPTPAPRASYAERRRARASQSQPQTVDETPAPAAVEEPPRRSARYSEIRKSRLPAVQEATSSASNSTQSQQPRPFLDARIPAQAHQSEQAVPSPPPAVDVVVPPPPPPPATPWEDAPAQLAPPSERKDINNSSDGPRLHHLVQEQVSMAQRLRDMEQKHSADLNGLREEIKSQLEAAERRIFSSLADEVERRARSEVGLAVAQIAGGLSLAATKGGSIPAAIKKDIASDLMETPSSAGFIKAMPVEEPEQEYETPAESVDCSPGYSRRKAHSIDSNSSLERKAGEVSSAELADSKQRLEAIGSIARRVSASLPGGPSDPAKPDRTCQPDPPPDLTSEQSMAHLAAMRRFASSVLGTDAANSEKADTGGGGARHPQAPQAAWGVEAAPCRGFGGRPAESPAAHSRNSSRHLSHDEEGHSPRQHGSAPSPHFGVGTPPPDESPERYNANATGYGSSGSGHSHGSREGRRKQGRHAPQQAPWSPGFEEGAVGGGVGVRRAQSMMQPQPRSNCGRGDVDSKSTWSSSVASGRRHTEKPSTGWRGHSAAVPPPPPWPAAMDSDSDSDGRLIF